MNDFLKQLNNAKDQIKLSATRKTAMKVELMAYVKRSSSQASSTRLGFFSRLKAVFSAFALRPLPLAAAVIVLMVVGGGTTAAAAGRALPGDRLYGWKTEINERVQLALLRNDADKIEFETTLAARRLAEAETLAKQGRLHAAEQAQVNEKFGHHADKVGKYIEKLQTDHQEEAAVLVQERFAASIQIQQQALLQTAGPKAEVTTDTETETTVDSSINATDSAIQSSEAIVKLEQQSHRQKQSEEQKRQKQEELNKAQKLIEEARRKLKSGAVKEAQKLNEEAVQAGRKVHQDSRSKRNEGSEKTDSQEGVKPEVKGEQTNSDPQPNEDKKHTPLEELRQLRLRLQNR